MSLRKREASRKLTDIYVDGDACPVREEIYRVAARLRLSVFVVSNGSRPIRWPGTANVSMVLVGDSADAADDWIAERIPAGDVCVTADIPLASRCLKKGARVVSPTGTHWTPANIGNALAGREIARHLRKVGGEYSRAFPADQEGQVPVPCRARYGSADRNTRGGPQVNKPNPHMPRQRLANLSRRQLISVPHQHGYGSCDRAGRD